MRRAIALACLLLSVLSAVAQDTAAKVDLMATFGGFVDGSSFQLAPDQVGTITRTGEGTYRMAAPASEPIDFQVLETAPCVFDLVIVADGKSTGGSRMDFNRISGFTLESRPAEGGFSTVTVNLAGAKLQYLDAAGNLDPGTSSFSVTGSVDRATMQAALDQLRTLCPNAAMAGRPTVDLVALLLYGVEDGAKGPMGVTSRTEPGQFSIKNERGEVTTISVVEHAPCVFEIKLAIVGQPDATISGASVLLDVTRVSEIQTDARTGYGDGLNRHMVTMAGSKDRLVIKTPTGIIPAPDQAMGVESSAAPETMASAGSALRAACPQGTAGGINQLPTQPSTPAAGAVPTVPAPPSATGVIAD